MTSAILIAIVGFLYFAGLDTGMPTWVFLAIAVSLVPHDMMFGPQAVERQQIMDYVGSL